MKRFCFGDYPIQRSSGTPWEKQRNENISVQEGYSTLLILCRKCIIQRFQTQIIMCTCDIPHFLCFIRLCYISAFFKYIDRFGGWEIWKTTHLHTEDFVFQDSTFLNFTSVAFMSVVLVKVTEGKEVLFFNLETHKCCINCYGSPAGSCIALCCGKDSDHECTQEK